MQENYFTYFCSGAAHAKREIQAVMYVYIIDHFRGACTSLTLKGLKANCAQHFNLLKTLFPYSLPKETAKYKIWQLDYVYPHFERPSKVGGFESETEESAAITARLKWRFSQPGQTCVQCFALAAVPGEARPAEPDRFFWLTVGKGAELATVSLLLHGCLRDTRAGAALPATELFQAFLTDWQRISWGYRLCPNWLGGMYCTFKVNLTEVRFQCTWALRRCFQVDF